jgi:hypothetical protein
LYGLCVFKQLLALYALFGETDVQGAKVRCEAEFLLDLSSNPGQFEKFFALALTGEDCAAEFYSFQYDRAPEEPSWLWTP